MLTRLNVRNVEKKKIVLDVSYGLWIMMSEETIFKRIATILDKLRRL